MENEMREWPDEIVDVFQGANVAYEDVVTLEPDELFVAYLNAVGLCEWADHIVAVHAWCHTDPAVGDEMPEHLGQVADEYKRVSAIRLAMDKRAEAVKARESELKEYLIDNIDVDNEAGVMGMRYRATIKTNEMPRMDAEYWPQFHAWIAENNRFDLLQKRLSDKAVMELINEGVELPGIEKMKVKSVSVKKID
jgi:hypothetical protein